MNNSDDLRIIAIFQGLACMAGVIAMGLVTGSHWAPWCAIASLGCGYLSTICHIEAAYPYAKSMMPVANGITFVSIALGIISLGILLL